MKTIDEMINQLVLDKSSMHLHTSGGYASVSIERDKLKLSDSSYEKTVFDLLNSVYAQYEKIVHAVPELGPQRLSYVVTEDSDEVTKTELYTPFKEVNSDEAPF